MVFQNSEDNYRPNEHIISRNSSIQALIYNTQKHKMQDALCPNSSRIPTFTSTHTQTNWSSEHKLCSFYGQFHPPPACCAHSAIAHPQHRWDMLRVLHLMIGNAQTHTHTHPWRLVLLLLLWAVFIQRTEGVCTYETVALSRRINGRNLRGDDDDDGRCALVYDGPWDRWTSEPEQQRSRCDPCIARDPSLRVSFTCTLRPEIRIFIELALDRSLLDHGRCGARTRHTHTQVFSLRAFRFEGFWARAQDQSKCASASSSCCV